MPQKLPVSYGSISHKILLISKFYDESISFKELNYINPLRFKTEKNINREILKLKLHNLVKTNEDSTEWKITSKGVAYIYDLAERHIKYANIKKF